MDNATIRWLDLGLNLEFALWLELDPRYECCVTFAVYHVAYRRDGIPFFHKRHLGFTTDTAEAQAYCTGSLKWDGCMDLEIGEEGYLHCCGADAAVALGTVLKHLHAEALALMSPG